MMIPEIVGDVAVRFPVPATPVVRGSCAHGNERIGRPGGCGGVVVAPEVAARIVTRYGLGDGVGQIGRDLHLTPGEVSTVLRTGLVQPVGRPW